MSALRGLYAITSAALCADDAALRPGVEAALQGGARLLQYRDKAASPRQREERAAVLLALCQAHGALLVINDDAALAQRVGAHGVHLGASDPPIAAARALLGARALIGASCGPSAARALQAFDEGAGYIGLGRFFDSRTKPDAPRAAIESLREARRQTGGTICVIGGITPDNAPPLVEAGADLVAAVEGVFGTLDPPSIRAAARRYAALF